MCARVLIAMVFSGDLLDQLLTELLTGEDTLSS